MLRKYKRNGLLALALSAFMLIPDVIYRLLNENYLAGSDGKSSAIAVLLASTIALSRSSRLCQSVLFVFFVWQSSQLMYFQYYGGFYSAFDIELMFKETADAATGFWDVSQYLIMPGLLSLLFYLMAVLSLRRLQPKCVTFPTATAVLMLLLLLPFGQSLKSTSSQKFQPNIGHSAMKNGFYSYSFFFARQIKKLFGQQREMPTYQAYELLKTKPKDANIVVIMGESLSYLNMGLFGYERDTTPDLDKFKADPNFIYRPSISSAVSTRVSLALFFNTVYEPDNAAHISSMQTSLFKLAKDAGFNTHYITTQKNAGGLTYSLSLGDIDTWKEHKDLSHYDSEYDDRLLLELDAMKLDYELPQFITLHMRSAHTPYIENYPKEREVYPTAGKDYGDYMKNSYDNSVLYTQKVTADIIEFFKRQSRPTYIFFTADHGELLGQKGKFGHNAVDLDIAKVPFLFYGVNLTEEAIGEVDANLGGQPNHYKIGKEVARVLGYRITNPNEEPGFYYLNGTDAFGMAGYLRYSLDD